MRGRRGVALLVMLFRGLAFLVALQCSGAVHFVIDAVELSEGHPHVTDDCGGDDDDCPAGCPPGCPTCHCGTGFLASLPPVAESGSSPPDRPLHNVRLSRHEDREPVSAARSSLFRPPRLLVLEA
jgi:hypothetical protein